MSTQDPHRIDRGTAERLLAGDPVASRGDARLLADLLAAAAAPARPHELMGERTALAAFRAAQLPAAASARRAPAKRAAVMKLFTVKAAVLATAALGGVAIAATTVPNPLADGPSSVRSSSPAERSPEQAGPTGAGDPTGRGESPAGSPSSTPPGQGGSPAPPDPATIGHCRAYLAKPIGVARDKALDTEAYAGLIIKAGGRDEVADYCQNLLAGQPAGEPTRGPKGQDDGKSPTGRPSKPAGH